MNAEKDPYGKDPHQPGAKLDAGKIQAWLMISGFARALNAVADVTTKGAQKYTPNGWQHVDDGQARYMEAFGRHMLALGTGERYDTDTGCLHKAQMIWNLLASLELELREAEGWKRREPVRAERAPWPFPAERPCPVDDFPIQYAFVDEESSNG